MPMQAACPTAADAGRSRRPTARPRPPARLPPVRPRISDRLPHGPTTPARPSPAAPAAPPASPAAARRTSADSRQEAGGDGFGDLGHFAGHVGGSFRLAFPLGQFQFHGEVIGIAAVERAGELHHPPRGQIADPLDPQARRPGGRPEARASRLPRLAAEIRCTARTGRWPRACKAYSEVSTASGSGRIVVGSEARSIASGTPSDIRTRSSRATKSPAPRPSAMTSSGGGTRRGATARAIHRAPAPRHVFGKARSAATEPVPAVRPLRDEGARARAAAPDVPAATSASHRLAHRDAA
jgi:hypothetical protein